MTTPESHGLARCKTCDGLIGPGHCTPVDGGCLFASRPRPTPVAPPEVAYQPVKDGRPASRIAPLLERLRRAWEACPDMRLGQLAVNARRDSSELYSVEDEPLVAAIEAACPKPAPSPGDAVAVRDALIGWLADGGGWVPGRVEAGELADALMGMFDVRLK